MREGFVTYYFSMASGETQARMMIHLFMQGKTSVELMKKEISYRMELKLEKNAPCIIFASA